MEHPLSLLLLVDVVLPLPLADTYTYSIPERLSDRVRVGSRVVVPFGAKRTYTAIVVNVRRGDSEIKLKEVVDVLDEAPVVLREQLELWRWIADYYLCTLGEVYKAALPSGLKLDGSYHPRTVTCVRLTMDYFDRERLVRLFAELGRAQKQADLLRRYLELSEAKAALTLENYSLLVELEKQALMEGQSEAALKGLRERGVLEVYDKEVSRLGVNESLLTLHHSPFTLNLSQAQQSAYDEIQEAFQEYDTCLLHGVTSSGKTEIYIKLIDAQLEKGQQVLYILPEIVLTAQLVERLKRVFGERLGVYHSKYTDAERVEVWKKQLSDEPYDIIVGVRSSVLLPFQRLGLVIVDEEHETSFKQQDPAPRYHARNVALVLAHRAGAKTLLGTATPSMESYYNAQVGRYGMVTLKERYGQVQLPKVEIVDLRDRRHRKEMVGPFSTDLVRAMREALERREQIILFQNRRGYAPQLECHTCGWVPRCTHCDVTLTMHRDTKRMTCHYCGSTYDIPDRCPNCQGQELTTIGYGTERIEDDIKRIFPQARVARMDLDSTRSRTAYEKLISDFQHGRTDILVGTQMVTKGLDFKRVSVVGILNADTMLNMPDFRSYERSFQMLSQVAGRAGRRSHQGLVLLQTKSPDLPVVQQVVTNDFEGLYRDQLTEREAFHYPPFSRLVNIVVKHRDATTVTRLSNELASLLRKVFGHRVLGPDTPAISRVQLMYIRRLVLKIEVTASMAEARKRLRQLQQYLLQLPQYRSAQIIYDVDPV